MANKAHQERFKVSKRSALLYLLCGLNEGRIPDTRGIYLRSGQIIDLLDDTDLPIRKSAMLGALRDAGVPHDSNNRFIAWVLHAYKEELDYQFWDYAGLKRPNIRRPEIKDTGDSQEV